MTTMDDDVILKDEEIVSNGNIQEKQFEPEEDPPTFRYKVFKSLLVGNVFLNMVSDHTCDVNNA